jgi:S1-C subfamily serine protease
VPSPYSDTSAPLYIETPNPEDFMMHIVGTAIQAAEGKLVTCAHVVNELKSDPTNSYLIARTYNREAVLMQPYPIPSAIPYYDPRTNQPNHGVDLSVLLVPVHRTNAHPYAVPNVTWGDSSQVGIGDPVIVGGYPLGRDMFLNTISNRGLVQPTFYSGIVSAVIPAMKATETRLLQISIPVSGE